MGGVFGAVDAVAGLLTIHIGGFVPALEVCYARAMPRRSRRSSGSESLVIPVPPEPVDEGRSDLPAAGSSRVSGAKGFVPDHFALPVAPAAVPQRDGTTDTFVSERAQGTGARKAQAPPAVETRTAQLDRQGREDFARYQALLALLRAPDTSPQVRREAIRSFVNEVEANGGFPIAGPEGLVFVYVASPEYDEAVASASRSQPLRLVGDFNGWRPAADDVLRDEGDGFFHLAAVRDPTLALPLRPGAERWRYKFVAGEPGGGETFFSDPLSRRFQYDENGRYSIVRGSPTESHLEQVRTIRSRALGNERPLVLYVPPGYDFSNRQYPVLYAHDGNNLFDPQQPNAAPGGSWNAAATADREIAAGNVRELIIAGIPNNPDRIDELTPMSMVYEGTTMGGNGAAYGRFITDEVKPLIDGRYRTLADPKNTGTIGSSLGGVISLYLGLTRPDVFGQIGMMSPTFDWGEGNHTLFDLVPDVADLALRDQRFYFYNGGRPPAPGEPDWDGPEDTRDNWMETRQMVDLFASQGVDRFPADPTAERFSLTDNILHWAQPDATHSEPSWGAEFFRPLRFLFPPEST